MLLNGGFMTVSSWGPLAARFGERYRLLRCDFRGQLLTPGPVLPEIEANAVDVVHLLDHLGLERVHVLGTSFGAVVAMVLAARYPERVASLVVVTAGDYATDAMFQDTHEFRSVVDDILAGGDRTAFHRLLVRDVYSSTYAEAHAELLTARGLQVAGLPDAWFAHSRDLVAAVESFDVRNQLAAITCPCLVVVAGDDRVMPPERGRALARAITNAQLAEHTTSGHVLVNEQPDWLADITLRFLDGIDSSTLRSLDDLDLSTA